MDMTSHTKKRKIAECEEKSGDVKEVLSDEKSSIPLKIGPWNSAEDEKLKAYVLEFGARKWEDVKKRTGLLRSGKSCRLRWLNHLRPELKKDPLTHEEKNYIIKLHYKLGNQWSLIASKLHGRTDNEIKNFWNTRLKKCQHTGEPIYPIDICSQIENEVMSGQNGDNYHSQALQKNVDTMIPPVEFKHLWSNQEINSYLSRICQTDGTSSMNKINELILQVINYDIGQEDNNVMNSRIPIREDYQEMNFQMQAREDNNILLNMSNLHNDELASFDNPEAISHKLPSIQSSSSPSHEDVDASCIQFFDFDRFELEGEISL